MNAKSAPKPNLDGATVFSLQPSAFRLRASDAMETEFAEMRLRVIVAKPLSGTLKPEVCSL